MKKKKSRKKAKVYRKVDPSLIAERLGAEHIITEPEELKRFEIKFGPRASRRLLDLEDRIILWANPDMHEELTALFKEVFPDGTNIVTASHSPSCRIDNSYSFGYRLVLEILKQYSRKS